MRIANKITLSIGLLASNRKETMQKCLDSLTPIRKAISTELIIIDTGCDTDLHNMLQSYADKMGYFTWCNDFSKARNASLALASGEWFLYLDDDEWFTDTEELIAFFQSGEYKKYGSASYIQRNFLDFDGNQYTDSWVGRMIKLAPNVQFKSKIHEYLSPKVGEDAKLKAIVHHYGYVYKTEEDKQKHFERNRVLLEEMIEEEPTELRWKLQLVQEFRVVEAYEEMISYGKNYLMELKDCKGMYADKSAGTFYASVVLGLNGLKDYSGVKAQCEAMRNDMRLEKLAYTFSFLSQANAEFWLGNYQDCVLYANKYLQDMQYFDKHQNELFESQTVPFVGEVFDIVKKKEIYSLLICSGLKQKSTENLTKYMDKLEWENSYVYVFEGMADTLIEAMSEIGSCDAFLQILDLIQNQDALCKYFYSQVEAVREKDIDTYHKVLSVIADTKSEHWYVWYARICKADCEKNQIGMKQAIEGFLQNVGNMLIIPEKIYEMAENYGINLEQYWKTVDDERWMQNVKDYMAQAGSLHIQTTLSRIKNVFSENDWKYQCFMIALLEKRVSRGPKEPWNLESYYDLLRNYTKNALSFYSTYYGEEVFFEKQDTLPEYVRAMIQIWTYLELESQNKLAALNCLKECVLIYPEWAEGIGKFLKQYPELEKQRSDKKKEEMRTLRNQVVAQVKDMMQKGQLEQAILIVGQLKQMFPEDLEVIALGLEVRLAMLE